MSEQVTVTQAITDLRTVLSSEAVQLERDASAAARRGQHDLAAALLTIRSRIVALHRALDRAERKGRGRMEVTV